MATSRAFGGGDGDILPIAVAIELLHNAFLVHDDIVDGSERRRGRPTLSAQYGIGLALNAGDALAVLSNQVLRAHRVLRARKVLLAPQVLPRTPFELYAWTVRPQRAEGSATRTRYL